MPRILGLLIVLALVTVACDSGDSEGFLSTDEPNQTGDAPSQSGDVPAECDRQPPYTIHAEALNQPVAGAPEVEVVDAIAQRIPVVRNAEGDLLEGEAKEQADAEAATTDLAIYAIHAADFPLDPEEFDGFGFARVEPPADGTMAVVSVLPPTAEGMSPGDVITHGQPEFEATTTFTTLGAYLQTADRGPSESAFTDMIGDVTILALDDDTICLRADVSVSDGDDPVAVIEGVIVADVVRVDDNFYLT